MQIHRIKPNAASELAPNPHPYDLAVYLVSYLFQKSQGAFFGKWDALTNTGTWFYSQDALAIFEAPGVDEIVYTETDRSRFRSVIFRLGSLAAEHEGDLCGIMQLLPEEGASDPGLPGRRYVVHGSFWPEAGLWLKVTIIPPVSIPSAGHHRSGARRLDPR